MPIRKNSKNKLEKLKQVLKQMIAAEVIWTKAIVCRKIGADPTFLSASPRWQASHEATRLYEQACKTVKAQIEASALTKAELQKQYQEVSERVQSLTSANTELQERCNELAAYNKQIRWASGQRIRVLKAELQKERDRVSQLEQQLPQQRGVA